MTDYDSIWRTQDEIRTVVNAVLGECIWNLSYSERRMVIELDQLVWEFRFCQQRIESFIIGYLERNVV